MERKMWAYLIHLGDNMWQDTHEHTVGPWEPRLTCNDDIWQEVTAYLPTVGFNTVLIDVGDGIEYESHPEISIPGAWPKAKLKAELDRLRSLGLTPLPKLNFSAGHDAWLKDYSRMLSTPIYYQVCEDLIREVAEVFDHPAYFHLGYDEENAQNQRGLQICIIRQHDLWWNDAYFFFKCCEKVGARPWIWGDSCWNRMDEFLRKMPKSVLLSNWYYGTIGYNPDGTVIQDAPRAYITLDEAGYEQVPTSSTWSNWWNDRHTMMLFRDHVSEERTLGFMTAPWVQTVPEMKFALLHDALTFANARKYVFGGIK